MKFVSEAIGGKSVESLPGIGPASAQGLHRFGITMVNFRLNLCRQL